MPTYLFQLGHQPHISTAEIKAVFSLEQIKWKVISAVAAELVISTDQPLGSLGLITRLGGTVKISELIDGPAKTPVQTANLIANFLVGRQVDGKIQFSFSGKNGRDISLKIKKQLKEAGRSVRYVEAKNSATILHNKLVEKQGDFTLFRDQVFVTRALQPFEDFGKRDYGRPDSDSFSGMLPPKLARILVNLSQAKVGDILLDPFCGSGTILMEAAHLGFTNFIGTDLSDKAINDTDRNLKWLSTNFHLPTLPYHLVKADVKQLALKDIKNKVDVICTEPYLGAPLRGTESNETLAKQATELKELYLAAFKSFAKLIKKGGQVIFIIPRFKQKNGWLTIDCAKEISTLGFAHRPFSPDEACLLYWRQGQKLGREIWRFEKI